MTNKTTPTPAQALVTLAVLGNDTSAAEIARQAAQIDAQAPQRLSGWDCMLLQLEGLTRGMPTGCGPVRAFHKSANVERLDAHFAVVFGADDCDDEMPRRKLLIEAGLMSARSRKSLEVKKDSVLTGYSPI